MKTLTLCVLMKEGSVLLAMKKRGFGAGRWNGYGGKLEGDETPEEGVVREIKEESGTDVEAADLEKLGSIDFYFPDKPDWNQNVIVYRTFVWKGEPIETEEMKPEWFSFENIPYTDMWPGDDEWLPYLLRGEKFTGEIHFKEEGKGVEKSDIRSV